MGSNPIPRTINIVLDEIKVIELDKDDPSLPTLGSHYVTASYYDLSVVRELEAWRMEAPLKKRYIRTLFEKHAKEPRVFAAVFNENQRGWIELGAREHAERV
jgi:hypothetical protein